MASSLSKHIAEMILSSPMSCWGYIYRWRYIYVRYLRPCFLGLCSRKSWCRSLSVFEYARVYKNSSCKHYHTLFYSFPEIKPVWYRVLGEKILKSDDPSPYSRNIKKSLVALYKPWITMWKFHICSHEGNTRHAVYVFILQINFARARILTIVQWYTVSNIGLHVLHLLVHYISRGVPAPEVYYITL